MKILHVLNSPKIGGIERFVYYLIKYHIQQNSVSVGLVLGKKEGELRPAFEDLNVAIYDIEIKPFDFNIKKYKELASISGNYDITHIHSFKPIREFILYKFGSNVIYTNHTVYGFGRNERKWDAIRRRIFVNYLNRPKLFKTYNSSYTKHFWETRGVNAQNSIVIENGVAFSSVQKSLTKTSLGLPDKFLVGTSSRLITWKRVDILIEAFSKFIKECPDSHLVVVGDGPERESLEKLTKDLNISDQTTFTGFKTNVEDYQSLMNVCVFPSTTESFGLVAIECMHLGKPVLVMKDGGGITELVEKIEPENVTSDNSSLALRLKQLYTNRDSEDQAQHNKRVNYALQFDMKKKQQEFLSLYQKIL